MAEIPFWIHDQCKWVSGILLSTTCSDILVSLIQADADDKRLFRRHQTADDLVLVEQWRGIQRIFEADTCILRMWNAWADQRDEVRFVVKKYRHRRPPSDNIIRILKTKHKHSTVKSHSVIKDTVLDESIEELSKIISIGDKTNLNSTEKKKTDKITCDISDEIQTSLSRCQLNETSLSLPYSGRASYADNLIRELLRVYDVNKQLEFAENNVLELEAAAATAAKGTLLECDKTTTPVELIDLNRLVQTGAEISSSIRRNMNLIQEMQAAQLEASRKMKQLEYDVNVVEKEGLKLARELNKVNSIILEDDDHETLSMGELLKKEVDDEIGTNITCCCEKSVVDNQELIPQNDTYDENTSVLLVDIWRDGILEKDGSTLDSDTGVSSMHSSSSSDDGTTEDAGTLV